MLTLHYIWIGKYITCCIPILDPKSEPGQYPIPGNRNGNRQYYTSQTRPRPHRHTHAPPPLQYPWSDESVFGIGIGYPTHIFLPQRTIFFTESHTFPYWNKKHEKSCFHKKYFCEKISHNVVPRSCVERAWVSVVSFILIAITLSSFKRQHELDGLDRRWKPSPGPLISAAPLLSYKFHVSSILYPCLCLSIFSAFDLFVTKRMYTLFYRTGRVISTE